MKRAGAHPCLGSDNAMGAASPMLLSSRQQGSVGGREALRARLRAIILLGGSVRPSELGRAVDRSLLDLPVDAGRTVLSLWQSQVYELATELVRPDLSIRILIDQGAAAPTPAVGDGLASVAITRDRGEYRGTGGILGDLGSEYGSEDLLLIANAAQVLVEDLGALAAQLAAASGELSLIAHGDGTPVGMMLMAGSAMRSIPHIGFIDFKEQVLPRLARERAVGVVSRPAATGIPIRLLDGYLSAVRAHHLRMAGKEAIRSPFDEDWVSTFSLVEPGASVGAGARVHDSVVLRGGVVQPGAVVVRSVVAPAGVAVRGKPVADRILTARSDERGAR